MSGVRNVKITHIWKQTTLWVDIWLNVRYSSKYVWNFIWHSLMYLGTTTLRTLHVVFRKIFTKFLQNFCAIFMKFLWNFCQTFAKFLQIVCKIVANRLLTWFFAKFLRNFYNLQQFCKKPREESVSMLFLNWSFL